MNALVMAQVALEEVTRHRLRASLGMLSIGVGVAAISIIVALGTIAQAAAQSIVERQTGRPATLSIISETSAREFITRVAPRLEARFERYGVTEWSRLYGWRVTVTAPSMSRPGTVFGVDPAFIEVRPLRVTAGRWFLPSDADLFAPALIVNETWVTEFGGSARLGQVLRLDVGAERISGRILGIVDDADKESRLYAPVDTMLARLGASGVRDATVIVHGGPNESALLGSRLEIDLGQAGLPHVTAVRVDAADDFRALFEALQLVLGFIAAVSLITGALGVLNLGLVTARQRASEFAIRRSFGATSLDVFGIVLAENVILSVLGGVLGVTTGVVLVTLGTPLLLDRVGVRDLPPYPLTAAVAGLLVASGVGAIAGFAPARLASRASIIETIRG
jgi:ABC-type antimicrobial peptide transport system, permease component